MVSGTLNILNRTKNNFCDALARSIVVTSRPFIILRVLYVLLTYKNDKELIQNE
jgi:hypothetical protein